MAELGVTMPDMAKKKPSKQGDGKGRSPAYVVFARVPPELGAAFEAYLESLRPKPSATAAIVLSLEEFLAQRGFWPPEQPAP